MRKKMVLSLGILSMVFFVATMCNPASAATYTVGVKVGDTADYTMSYSLYPNSTKLNINVFGIVGTVVTLNLTQRYANGTKYSAYQISGDVASASGLLFLYLIAKNLTTNDPIAPGSTFKINKTETMSVAGASRTVCHLNITSISSGVLGNIWWDQQTGIVVKRNFAVMFLGWANLTMTSTSMWSGGLDTTTLLLIGGIALVLIVVAAIALRRKGKK